MDCIDLSKTQDPADQNYIFGYGSLMEDTARMRTTPTAVNAWPVMVRGLRRGWWGRAPVPNNGLTATYLGAIEDAESQCNGVIYPVSEVELAATDASERAYRRCKIDPADIRMLDGTDNPPAGLFWAYLNTADLKELKHDLPSPSFPMVQSYVDTCVNGAIQVEGRYRTAAGFTQTFIANTDFWSKYWVNDRIYPRLPFAFQPTAWLIDGHLQTAERTADLYYEVELEPATWENRKPVRPPV